MRPIYAIAIRVFVLLHQCAAYFIPKAKWMVDGRKSQAYSSLQSTAQNESTWLFHCASLGEYEMALPIALELVKKGNIRIVFSFYSPSGFTHAKLPLEGKFVKTYLPWDKTSDVRAFLQAVQPVGVVIIRYEFWLEFLYQVNRLQIPLYLLGTSLRENQFLWKAIGKAWKKEIAKAQYIGVIKPEMVELGKQKGLHNVEFFGDPKFSRALLRVQHVKNQAKEGTLPPVEAALLQWINQQNTLVLGSSWPAEESLILQCLNHPDLQYVLENQSWKILIAPHNISETHTRQILHQFRDFSPILFTEFTYVFNENSQTPSPIPSQHKVLILNSIGQLPIAYSAAKIALIGGAFGKGLHNITEALCFGVPVLFGPNHQKFPEAQDAIDAGIAISVNNAEELLTALLPWINRTELRDSIAQNAIRFTQNHQADIEKFVKLTDKPSIN